MGNLKTLPALLLGLLVVGLTACGSSEDSTTTRPPAVSAATAHRLANLSEQVATDLDAGNSCDAAHAADQLRAAVESADLSASLRPGVESAATRLVDGVNCPPPPPPPEPQKEEEKKKPKHGGEDHHGDEKGPPGHSGGLPPGQAQLRAKAG